MGRIKLDFDTDVPADKVDLSPFDGFARGGKAIMCIDMIGNVAGDLATGEGPDYEDALAWVNDPRNLEVWLAMVDASPQVIPALQSALLDRPNELVKCCEHAMRSYSRTEEVPFGFMRAMGMSIVNVDSHLSTVGDYEAFESQYAVVAA